MSHFDCIQKVQNDIKNCYLVPILVKAESANKRPNRVSMISLELDLTGDFSLVPV